jgi:hypothetical protein
MLVMQRRRSFPFVFLPAVLVGALACANTPATLPTANDSQTAEPTAAGQDSRRLDDPNAVQPDNGATLLLDPGTEPRAPLRFRLRVGDVALSKIAMTFDTTVDLLGNHTVTHFGIEFDSQTEVVAVDAAKHEHHVQTTIVSARLLSEPVDPAATRAALAPYIGLVTWVRLDSRGRPLEYRYTRDGAAVDPSTISGLDENVPTMALPEEPVGVGARWQEFDEVERNGFTVLQTSEHVLVGRQGDRLDITTTVTQEPLSNVMSGPGMPPGTRAELRHFESKGLGKSTCDLGRPIPVDAVMSVDGTLGALIITDQQQAEMSMQLRVETRIALQP